MARLIILVGPPGSGKSTYAKALENDEHFVRINQDDQGKEEHYALFMDAVDQHKNIVVDRMNFNQEQRDKYLTVVKLLGVSYSTEIIVFHESYDTCYVRCAQRLDHPTVKTRSDAHNAIKFFFKKYERPNGLEADVIQMRYPKGIKSSAVICDLDGTLCNIDHRLKWVRGEGKKNWPMFFAGIKDDVVNKWCKTLLERIMGEGMFIVLCSGRGSETRFATTDWLYANRIDYDDLFMRPEGDYRRDDVVKEIILDFEILTRYTPYFMIDDRQQVVDMYRKRGFTVLQCAKGDF